MSQSLFKMLAHIVFSAKNRADLIAPEIENDLFGYMHGIVGNNDAKLIIAGGTMNHVHLLVSLPRKIDISELVGDVKRGTSNWIKKQNAKFADFY
jgi:putative transposase